MATQQASNLVNPSATAVTVAQPGNAGAGATAPPATPATQAGSPGPVPTTPLSAAQKLGKELNQLKPDWKSILVGEDLVVAALQKSLRRNGVSITSDAAYQAVRDVLGQLISMLGDDALTRKITIILRGSDGSSDGEKLMPPPNP